MMLVRLSRCATEAFHVLSYVCKSKCDINFVRKMSKRLFFEEKGHALLYAKYRPTYPAEVYKKIAEYCHEGDDVSDKLNLAVDIGCGNGQSTVPLCKLFKHVIGYDASSEQISHAPKDIENVSFKVGPAEDLSFLNDNSVDLITVATALHWLNLDLFYPEVRRVVRPGGVFVAYGYGTCYFKNKSAQDTFLQFYYDLIGPYSDTRRRHIENEYQNLSHPFNNNIRIDSEDIQIRRSMPIDALIGYLSSLSAWKAYLRQHPGSDTLEEYRKRYQSIFPDGSVDVYWRVFMLLGRKEE